jgi:hypothetical protein
VTKSAVGGDDTDDCSLVGYSVRNGEDSERILSGGDGTPQFNTDIYKESLTFSKALIPF